MIRYLLCFFLAFNCYADCPQKVSPINKGDVAQCDGFIFSDDAEKQAAQAVRDADFFKQVNDQLVRKSTAQQTENEILERRLNLYMQQSEVLAKDTARRDNTESLYRVLYFGLGVVMTGIIASNVSR